MYLISVHKSVECELELCCSRHSYVAVSGSRAMEKDSVESFVISPSSNSMANNNVIDYRLLHNSFNRQSRKVANSDIDKRGPTLDYEHALR